MRFQPKPTTSWIKIANQYVRVHQKKIIPKTEPIKTEFFRRNGMYEVIKPINTWNGKAPIEEEIKKISND